MDDDDSSSSDKISCVEKQNDEWQMQRIENYLLIVMFVIRAWTVGHLSQREEKRNWLENTICNRQPISIL